MNKKNILIMPIKQIKVGSDNFSYIIFSDETKKAAIVDPGNNIDIQSDFIKSKKLELEYIIITHHHRDHTGNLDNIKEKYPDSIIVSSKTDGEKLALKPEIYIDDNESINLGEIKLRFLLTPGHTAGGISIILDDEAILTGDTLFIDDCGRTDMADGSLNEMFKTLNEKIKKLPDKLIVYPGHDYGNKTYDTLGNQKKTNKTLLAKNIEEFSKIP